MATNLRTLLATMFIVAILLNSCDGHEDEHKHKKPKRKGKPRFKAGPWCEGKATFYDGSSTSFGGACSYKDVEALGYGKNTAAVSEVMFKKGEACGSCYELRCKNDPKWCRKGSSLIVTATDHCPGGGWCAPPHYHFDVARSIFTQLAIEEAAGVIPIEFRRVPCKRKGGMRFKISGNPYFYQVVVTNVAAAGDVVGLEVKGNKKLKWTHMERDWGSTWKTSCILQGEKLTFRVRSSDGRSSTSWGVAPENWQFDQTYVGKNFR